MVSKVFLGLNLVVLLELGSLKILLRFFLEWGEYSATLWPMGWNVQPDFLFAQGSIGTQLWDFFRAEVMTSLFGAPGIER